MLHNGSLGKNKIVDHIDGNKENNKIENLQVVTDLTNVRKRAKQSKTMYNYIGVRKLIPAKSTWYATINMVAGVINLGTFKTEGEAVIVRDRAYVLRLLEDPIIKTKENKKIFINRCKNKLNLSESDIEMLKNHITGLNNKDLTVL